MCFNINLGAVVGYGYPLQGCCLEGFDFLGLHQICAGLMLLTGFEARGRRV